MKKEQFNNTARSTWTKSEKREAAARSIMTSRRRTHEILKAFKQAKAIAG
jgi:hypothetical protein